MIEPTEGEPDWEALDAAEGPWEIWLWVEDGALPRKFTDCRPPYETIKNGGVTQHLGPMRRKL